MSRKFILFWLYLFFAAVTVKYLFNLHHAAEICNGWVIGDWLINYSAGFVRRGLSGWLMLHLSGWLGLKLNFTVTLIQSVLALTCLSLFLALLQKKELNLWFLIGMVSPATLLFPIWDWLGSGRKEIILFTLFAAYLFCLNWGLLKDRRVAGLFVLGSVVATFFHELFFFYTPYFVLAAWLKAKVERNSFSLFPSCLMVAGAFLALIPLALFGSKINGEAIGADLVARGLSPNICNGVLSFNLGPSDVILWAKTYDYGWLYGITLVLSLLPFCIMTRTFPLPGVSPRRAGTAILLLFLFSAPLFLVAVDWGRWIHIHCLLLLFTATFLLKEQTPEAAAEARLQIPRLWNARTQWSERGSHLVFGGLVFCYIAGWCLPICGTLNTHTMKIYSLLYEMVSRLL